MKVLSLDTSNEVMGVAVCDNKVVLGEIVTNLKKNHSVRLLPAVKTLLEEVRLQPKELEKVAVAHGPGSYTGVRIGVTVAKTLAYTLNIPLVGVSSLEVLAQNGRRFHGKVSPLFDARRGQVYSGLYGQTDEGFTHIMKDRIVLLTEWLELLKGEQQPVLFLGKDLDKHGEAIREILGDQACFAGAGEQNPRPGDLALLGENRQAVSSVHPFVPEYLQLAEAESKWLASQE